MGPVGPLEESGGRGGSLASQQTHSPSHSSPAASLSSSLPGPPDLLTQCLSLLGPGGSVASTGIAQHSCELQPTGQVEGVELRRLLSQLLPG